MCIRDSPVKGANGSRPALSPSASKKARGLQILGTDGLKVRLCDRLSRLTGIVFSNQLPLAFMEQILAERLVTRWSRGRPLKVWERHTGRIAAEALDCAVMSLAARSILAISPQRRTAELSSRVALPSTLLTVIRSAWLTGDSPR